MKVFSRFAQATKSAATSAASATRSAATSAATVTKSAATSAASATKEAASTAARATKAATAKVVESTVAGSQAARNDGDEAKASVHPLQSARGRFAGLKPGLRSGLKVPGVGGMVQGVGGIRRTALNRFGGNAANIPNGRNTNNTLPRPGRFGRFGFGGTTAEIGTDDDNEDVISFLDNDNDNDAALAQPGGGKSDGEQAQVVKV